MKKTALLFSALMFSLALLAQPPKGPADKGMTFGTKIDATNAINVDELPGILEASEKATVKVEGKVVEVCKAEGCWLRMQTANGTMLVKMKDHAYLVPLSLNGKTIVAEGTASMKTTSVEMLRHYAEDGGKSKDEIEKITEPKREIVMQASGILVM
jgi:hypothetical protein